MILKSLLRHPRRVLKTGDDSAARSLVGYAWRMAGGHGVSICLFAVAVSLVNLVPLELQRRIVNEVVGSGDLTMLFWFGGIYLGTVILHQALKFALRMYEAWLSESTIRYTRRHLLRLYGARRGEDEAGKGRAVSIVGSEVEILGGFVGESISQAFANLAMLIGVLAYMLVVEPRIAIFAIAVLLPQVILTPLLQRRLNRLIERRVGLMRDLGDRISVMAPDGEAEAQALLPDIYRNRMRFLFLKFLLKTVLNLLSALGPATVVLVGGYLVMQGQTQVGVIVAFISGFDRMAEPLRQLIAFYRQAAQANVQHRLIAEWMEGK